MKEFFLCCISICISLDTFAQETWSLEECVNRAREKNLDIQDAKLSLLSSEQQLIQSKLSLFPSLNGGAAQGFNYGRTVDPYSNEFTNLNVKASNFSISSSMTLFNGFQNINKLRKDNYEYLAKQYDIERVVNDISMNVTTSFLQLLFNKELVIMAEKQLEIILQQEERINKLVEEGQLAKTSLLETRSQVASEQLQLINVKSQKSMALLNIKQLLEIEADIDFDIEVPIISMPIESNIPSTNEIYKYSLEFLPDIKSAEYRLKSSEKSLAISRGLRSPRITLSGSIGSGYSDARTRIVSVDSLGMTPSIYQLTNGENILMPILDYTSEITPFNQQLKDNLSNSLSFSISIPIFNGWTTNSSIANSKIWVMSARNTLQKTKNALRKQTEQVRADVLAAEKQYQYAKRNKDAFKEVFNHNEKKFNEGMINIYDYNESKNKFMKAQSDLIKSKYDYLFKIKILDFYMGNPLTL